jgi:hypothetical protein
MEVALDQAQAATGADLGEGVRQALLSLGGYLLIETPERFSPDVLNWSVQTLARAIGARMARDPAWPRSSEQQSQGNMLQDQTRGCLPPKRRD